MIGGSKRPIISFFILCAAYCGKPANLCQPLKYKKLKPKSSRKKRMTNRPAMSMKIAGLGIHDTAVSWS